MTFPQDRSEHQRGQVSEPGTVRHARLVLWLSLVAPVYLPFFALLFAAVVKRLRLPWAAAVLVTLVGAAPMAVHGYLIVFRGSRLF